MCDVIKGDSFELHQVGKGSFRADMFHASLGKGILDSARYSNSILTEGTTSQDNMSFGFIHDSKGESIFNGNILRKHDVLMGDEGGPLSSYSHWSSFQFKRDDLLIRKYLLDVKESVTTNIGNIAMKNGFMQMGYFGSEYKKTFGETASETLRRK